MLFEQYLSQEKVIRDKRAKTEKVFQQLDSLANRETLTAEYKALSEKEQELKSLILNRIFEAKRIEKAIFNIKQDYLFALKNEVFKTVKAKNEALDIDLIPLREQRDKVSIRRQSLEIDLQKVQRDLEINQREYDQSKEYQTIKGI